MSRINFVGFDMDATLAIYNSPQTEELAFNLARDRLVEIGYPREIENIVYDSSFAVRGLWFDKKLGFLLKTDEHSNILHAWRGLDRLSSSEIRRFYSNKHIILDDTRIFVYNTVFNTPEIFLVSAVVEFFEKNEEYAKLGDDTGYEGSLGTSITYRDIFSDCRQSIDHIHETVLMCHIFGEAWEKYFDLIIVNGKKPSFFAHANSFRLIDRSTGEPYIGEHKGGFRKGHVYSAGSVTELRRLTGLTGKDTLYVGDHIFGDVLKSKKAGGWRTLLIVPELAREMEAEDDELSDVVTRTKAEVKLEKIRNITTVMESKFGATGSLMRSGWRGTYYSAQVRRYMKLFRYADIYTANVYNLSAVGSRHVFSCPIPLLPHERFIQETNNYQFNEDQRQLLSSTQTGRSSMSSTQANGEQGLIS